MSPTLGPTLWFGRSFLEKHKDPKPVVETIRKFTKVYPYEPGGVGTPIAEFLAGKAELGLVLLPAAGGSSRVAYHAKSHSMKPTGQGFFIADGSGLLR